MCRRRDRREARVALRPYGAGTDRADPAAEQGEDAAADAVKAAVKRLDKAATKGIIHKNAAARRKSRLQKRINRIASAES